MELSPRAHGGQAKNLPYVCPEFLIPPTTVLPTERPKLDELTLERVLEELETLCHQNMARAIETQEGLGIEYDEDVVCDVCRSPEGEDGNEMVFCDKCNVCVHQVGSPLLPDLVMNVPAAWVDPCRGWSIWL